MTAGYLAVSLGYLMLALAVLLIEHRRIRRTGPDAITVFVALFWLQCCVSGIVICAALPFVDHNTATGTWFIDNIFRASDPTDALIVLFLTVAFVVFFYAACAFGRLTLLRRDSVVKRPPYVLVVNGRRLALILGVGAFVTALSFWWMGDDMLTRYVNLLLLRADDSLVERTALNSNAFALTQTWGWLSVIPLFMLARRGASGLKWWGAFLVTLCFALMGVSRRALFLPLLMSYLALGLASKRWRVRWVVAAMGPLVFWVAFGKDLLSGLAYGGTVASALGGYQSWVNAILRAASDIGTTVVESIGTIALIHLPPRFGVDHLLSAAQRIPDGMMGWNIDWPERMVRISTRTFVGDWHQDVPPGMMGQMWLDFRIFGSLVWGVVFGLQMSVVQHYWRRTVPTLEAAIVFVIVIFAVALPVNTGSFDFTFSVDIFALAAAIYWCCSFRPERRPIAPADPAVPLVSAPG